MSEVIQGRLYAILLPSTDIQSEINRLESQMEGLQPGSPEEQYDELMLKSEQMELENRENNPNLDPQTLAGSQALAQILAENPAYQAIAQQLEALKLAHPSECTKWGIPMDQDGAKFVEIN